MQPDESDGPALGKVEKKTKEFLHFKILPPTVADVLCEDYMPLNRYSILHLLLKLKIFLKRLFALKRIMFRTIKLNFFHRDYPPALAISNSASVGVQL